jgi:NAD-dependent deacetylase
MSGEIDQLKAILAKSDKVVFFGGAGVSTESGIPDFRSVDGLYNQKYDYPPEQILSHTFFMQKTAEFYKFYRDKLIAPDGVDFPPNPAHIWLAQNNVPIITQNIDGLHSRALKEAGNWVGEDGEELKNNIFELHGSIHRNYCMKCHQFYNLDQLSDLMQNSLNSNGDGVPHCSKEFPADGEISARKCGGLVKPDVVLYEEGLNNDVLDGAVKVLQTYNTLIVGGTSLTVYPAAGLIRSFYGDNLVLLNRDKTQADESANLIIREPIGKVFSMLD